MSSGMTTFSTLTQTTQCMSDRTADVAAQPRATQKLFRGRNNSVSVYDGVTLRSQSPVD